MRHTVFIILCILFVSFVLLSKYEDRGFVRNLDLAVTVKLQERIDKSTHLRLSAFVGNLMEGATFFASPEFTVVMTIILTGVTVYDRKKKKWNIYAAMIPLALVLLVATEVVGKSVVHHPSPPFSMIKHPTTIFSADYINEQFSYPSGHAARAAFLSLIILTALTIVPGFVTKRRIYVGAILSLYTGLVAVSRIYLGHHWFSDVLGGLLVGVSFGVVVMATIFRQRQNFS